jgi:hypothetical protein
LVHRSQAARIGIDTVDIDANRQLGTVSVVDRATPRRYAEQSEVLSFGHLTQSIPTHDLELKRAHQDQGGNTQEPDA